VFDVIVRGDDVPADVRRSLELWVGCVAGALEEASCRDKLARAGFEAIDIEPTRVYRAADAKEFLQEAGLSSQEIIDQIEGRIMSGGESSRKRTDRNLW
jgi:arsenite methyltransferase